MELTAYELQALKTIASSDFYENGRQSVVWDYSVYDICTIPNRSRAGVYSSLVQKGFINISEGEKKYLKDANGNKVLNPYWDRGGLNFGTIQITAAGYATLDRLHLIDEHGSFI